MDPGRGCLEGNLSVLWARRPGLIVKLGVVVSNNSCGLRNFQRQPYTGQRLRLPLNCSNSPNPCPLTSPQWLNCKSPLYYIYIYSLLWRIHSLLMTMEEGLGREILPMDSTGDISTALCTATTWWKSDGFQLEFPSLLMRCQGTSPAAQLFCTAPGGVAAVKALSISWGVLLDTTADRQADFIETGVRQKMEQWPSCKATERHLWLLLLRKDLYELSLGWTALHRWLEEC